jgi:hypothetical protein
MSDKKHKGLHDPWRMHEPGWKPPEGEKGAGTPGSDEPLDWDLLPDVVFLMKVPNAAGALKIHGANTAEGAVTCLLHAAKLSPTLMELLASAGFEVHEPDAAEALPGFKLRGIPKTSVLVHRSADSALDGFNRLVLRLLAACSHDREMQKHLEQLGVVPLLTS